MPELEDVTYSRTETIRAVRGYHAFLTNMYLDESRIAEPPGQSGWPQITPSNFRTFGKTDEVISLLRHLPYITGAREDPWGCRPHAAPSIKFHDYSSDPDSNRCLPLNEEGASRLITVTENGVEGQVPPHVVGIISGNAEEGAFLIDTELGIVHWTDCPTEIQYKIRWNTKAMIPSPGTNGTIQGDIHDSAGDGSIPTGSEGSEDDINRRIADVDIQSSQNSEERETQNPEYSGDDSSELPNEHDPDIIEQIIDDPYDDDWCCPENEQDWRADSGKWAIGDFFQVLKLQFRMLHWIPISDRVVMSVSSPGNQHRNRMLAEVEKIWREHGWPAAEAQGTFDKVKCLAHIRQFLCDKYPEVGELIDVYS